MSLHPQQERLKKKLATREEEWQQRHEKLDRLRQARVIETDTATQFKLEQQIKDEEAELHTVEQNIDQLQHEIQQIERESEIQLPLSPALSSDFCLQRASTPTDVFNPQNSEKVGAQGFHPISSDWETIDFQPYLASLIADETYQRQWGSYTSTDAIGQVQVSPSATVLDVGLMVRLMQSEQPDDVRNPEHQKQTISERLPVLQGIRKYAPAHVLLMGRPGSGKTTALLRLLVDEAKQAQADAAIKIPVLVELRYLDAERPSVLERIQTFLSRHSLQLEEAALKTALAGERFLLLLDGVNELPSEAAQRSLNRFRQDYAKTPMVFVTRDIALGGDLGIAKKLKMQPLSEAQMRQFVQVYLPEQGEFMVRQLQGRLREMGQTPLLLWMLCEVFKGLNQLPSNLGLLFRWFAGEYNKLKRDVPVAAGLHRWQDEILQQLAFTLMQAEKPTAFRVAMPRSQAETILTAFLTNKVDYPAQRAKAWLEDLLEHHLLQLTSQNQLEFHHQLLQEYYAAEALLRHLPHLSNEQLQQDYLNSLKWTEPIALMLAMVEQEAQALRVVKLALDVDWMLAARLAGEVKPKFQEKSANLVKRFSDRKNLPDWLKVRLLGKTGSEHARQLLFQFLSNSDISTVRSAAYFIGKTGDRAAIDLLTQRLNDIDSRFFAQKYYGGADRTGDLWAEHIEALAYLAPEKAIQFLWSRVLDEGDDLKDFFIVYVVTEAPQLLMALDAEGVLPELIRRIEDAKFAHKDEALENQKSRILSLISYAKNYEIAIPVLISALEQQESEFIQKIIIQLLGESTNNCVDPVLVNCLSHKSYKLREEASSQLIKRKIENTSELEKLLESNNWETAWSAAFVLGSLGYPTAIPILSAAMKKDGQHYTRIRCAAAELLACFGKKEVIPELSSALRSPWSLNECKNGIRGLAKLRVEGPLWELLQSKDRGWQTAAVELARLGKAEVLPKLCQVLVDLGDESSNDVIQLLAKFANSDTIDWLLEALQKTPEQHEGGPYFYNRIAFVLVQCCPEILENRLRSLIHILIARNRQQLFWIVSAIQNHCKFYSYEIWQEAIKIRTLETQNTEPKSLTAQSPQSLSAEQLDRIDQTTQRIEQHTRQMANETKHDFSGATFQAPVNFGDSPAGDFIGTQNNYGTDSDLQGAMSDLQTLLHQLQTQHPHIATEPEALAIIEAEFTEIKQANPHRLGTLRQHLLNPERHRHAAKAALGEVVKHYREKNIWTKTLLTYFDKLSEGRDAESK